MRTKNIISLNNYTNFSGTEGIINNENKNASQDADSLTGRRPTNFRQCPKWLLFNIPKHHWSDAPLVRRIIDPTTHWSEAPLVRRNKISFNEDYKVIT